MTADPLIALLPGGCSTEAEEKLRRRLIKARDLASARVVHCTSQAARTLLWLLIEAASAHIFAPATEDDLRGVASYCLRLFMCANFAEEHGG